MEDIENEPEYHQFKYKWREAIAFLQERECGIAVAALYHPKIGDIDLIWGKYRDGDRASSGYGLAKVAAKHPEVLENLQPILLAMDAKYINESTGYNLKGYGYKGNVRLIYNGKARRWLMTIFKKEKQK